MQGGCGFLAAWSEVTAADRAAATVRREGASADAVRVSSVMRFAHDCSLCGGNLLSGASCKASPERGGARQRRAEGFVPPTLAGRGGSVSRRDHSPSLSETRPPFRRNQARRNAQPERQPLFGREGSGGRGASLREAASPPESPPHLRLFEEGARGRGLLYQRSPLPRKFHHSNGYSVTGLSSFLPFSLSVSRRLSMDVAFVRTVGVKSL